MEGQTKEKLLYILDILKKTDEQHPLNTGEIIAKLAEKGVRAERKSVARDIAALRSAGYSIILCEEYKNGFYMTDQLFEDYELKMIADAVASAKFLTYADTKTLVGKLCELATENGEQIIRKHTCIDPEIKSANSAVKYNIDKVITAIKRGRRITFQYYEIGQNGKMHLKRKGHVYEISPYYLCWTGDSYYLIGNSKSHDHLTHFFIDMMTNVEITRVPIRPREEIEELRGDFSIGEYLRTNVNMYTGEVIDVTLECSQRIAKDLRDKFGEVTFTPIGDGRFSVEVKATEGEGLLRWLMEFSAEDVTVAAPETLRQSLLLRAKGIAERYGE